MCLNKAVEAIEQTILKRAVQADETMIIIFSLKTETVTAITIYKNENCNSKYDT